MLRLSGSATSQLCAQASGGHMQVATLQGQDVPTQVVAEAGSGTQAEPRALSARTVRFYAGDWIAFDAWCRDAGAMALPADAPRSPRT